MSIAAPLAPVMVDTADEEDIGNPDLSITAQDNGNVVVDLSPKRKDDAADNDFDRNLAQDMDAGELAIIAENLLQGIEADIQSRAEWVSTRSRGIDLLGLQLEEPRGDVGTSSAPLEGMSTVRHPLLLEACLRSQANASGELLPASGPAKIENDGDETTETDAQAEVLEKGFNRYLTKVATEYYPDTRRALFWSSFGGSHFKKLYHCPLRRRPTSESVDANDLIVASGATDLSNAPRVTHRIKMAPSVMKRMQIVKAYRDVALTQPQLAQNQVDIKKETVEGVRTPNDRPEDQPYTLYESYCEYDIAQFAPPQFKDKALPLPYRITVDKDSRQILEVRRFWKEDDPQCLRKKRIVKYPFVEAMGIYGIGLLHILGNSTNALTAAWREALDAGMFASFPGFLYLKSAGKQLTNEFRLAPASGVGLDSPTGKIQDVVMAPPYRDVTPGLMQLIDKITEVTQRVGGTAELPVGEGKQDAPVGTTLALIEQATKIESAVHKGLHTAQSEEFEIFFDLFREDPESFWRHDKDCKDQWDEQKFLSALDNCKLVPVADPNTPSHMHRIAKALAIKQLQAANPQLYDAKAVDTRVLKMIKVDDVDSLFAPPPTGEQPPDPIAMAKAEEAKAKMLQAQTAAQKVQNETQNAQAKLADSAAQRQSDENIATLHLASELVIHGDQHGLKTQQHALAANQAAHDQGMGIQSALHEQGLAHASHGLAVGEAVHGAHMAERQHEHDADMDRRAHALEVHQALNPPKPAPAKPKSKS